MKMRKKKIVLIAIAVVVCLTILVVFIRFLSMRSASARQDTLPGGRKVLYYRNPMNPEVTSPVPMKDSMGMDYVPVYEEAKGSPGAGIYISPEKQQLIGVKKEKAEKRELVKEIVTVGKVAFDPELYVTQEEFIQASRAAATANKSELPAVRGQADSLVESARKKLLLLGMSSEQIDELGARGKPQEELYLPGQSGSVWVYITIYEYEAGLVKEGQEVAVEAVAFPGEVFKGKIRAITPVLEAQTRSLKVRAELKDPEHKLKPQMFVNAKIEVDLGEKLVVPESAVLDTGIRTVVYVVRPNDMIEQRTVVLGQKAAGYYEVLDGLRQEDTVITSGNFLIDSESKLKGIDESPAHAHGE